MLRMIFDSDGGVDDATALWWACTAPDVDLVAVTAVSGNVTAAQAAVNLSTVLAAAGRSEVPVAVGPGDPVGPTPPLRRAAAIHGSDGLGDAGLAPAPLTLDPRSGPEVLAAAGAGVTVVATGPLSNLARALDANPGWAGAVDGLVVMGGSARAGGNARPAAEANFANDPSAAACVVSAGWAAPPLLVGLDVTHRATLDESLFRLLDERRTPAAAFLAGPLRFYRQRGSALTADGECPCHDLLAVMAAARPGLVSGPELPLAVDTGGSAAWGASVVDFRHEAFARRGIAGEGAGDHGWGRWTIGLEVDVDRFRAEVAALFGG